MIRGFSVSLCTGLTLSGYVKAAVWKTWGKATTVLNDLASGLCGQLSPFSLYKRAAGVLNCLPSDRFLWFRDNFFLDSCLQHPQILLIVPMIGSVWFLHAGRRVTANGLTLFATIHCWWQKLCPSRLPVQLHTVSGRPLPLKDLFFCGCQEMSC